MPRATAAEMQERKNAIYTFAKAQNPVTVRGIYYHLTTRGLVPKTKAGYRRAQYACQTMRLKGELPFEWITDNSRWVRQLPSHLSIDAALESTARQYRRDFLAFTGAHIEIWLEKDALAGIFTPVTYKWDVPLYVSSGFSSTTFTHDAATYIEKKKCDAHIYIFSDYDASGVELAKAIDKRLREFTDKTINVHRALLTKAQVDAWNLPTRKPKAKDKAKGFDYCAELDAVPPEQLRSEVEKCITEHCDPGDLRLLRSIEADERDSIRNLFSYHFE